MQRPFKGNCACVRAFERARSLITIFFLSFLLSLFLLCAICKLRNCRRSKMCHSSSWFFAAALSSSLPLSHSLSTLFIYSFCSASASRASLRNARDLREYRSHVVGFLDFFFFLMCKFFLCPLTWCTHTITHAHVQSVFQAKFTRKNHHQQSAATEPQQQQQQPPPPGRGSAATAPLFDYFRR